MPFATKLELVETLKCSEELKERLIGGRSTGVAFISCSEMGLLAPGIPEEQDLPVFIWQNIGGCIDDKKKLEELVQRNKISDLIIYAHYPCALLDIGLGTMSVPAKLSTLAAKYFVEQTADVKQFINQNYGEKRTDEVMRKAAEKHVIKQLIEVMHLLPMSNSLGKHDLKLHGWLWIEDEKCLVLFDPKSGSFR